MQSSLAELSQLLLLIPHFESVLTSDVRSSPLGLSNL